MAELTPLYMDISSVYSGDELGLPYRDIVGEGVVDLAGGDLQVTEKAGTPGLSVDVAAGAAWVLGDTNPDAQPIYRVRNDAVVNLGISPDPSQARKVIIVAQVTDETFAGTGRTWELQAIHGTPAASPTEPATPDSALKLAVIDVAAAATEIVNADITDSRGAYSVGAGSAKTVVLQVTDPNGSALTTGDGKAYFTVPSALNGLDMTGIEMSLTTVSSAGIPTVQIANVTDGVDMLSTKVTVDASEFTSATAATPAVIDTTKDDVVTGDLLRVDIDVAGTGAKGLQITLTFS